MIENILPNLYYYSFEAKPDAGHWKIRIKFTTTDFGGIKNINVKLSSGHGCYVKDMNYAKPFYYTIEYDKTFHVKYDGSMSIGEGIDIQIKITDANANFMEKEDHIKSIKEVAQSTPGMLTEWIREKVGGWVLEKFEKEINSIFCQASKENSNSQFKYVPYASLSVPPSIFITYFVLLYLIRLNDIENIFQKIIDKFNPEMLNEAIIVLIWLGYLVLKAGVEDLKRPGGQATFIAGLILAIFIWSVTIALLFSG